MKINKQISKYNHTVYKNRNISGIVLHWVGAVSTAKNNADYFGRGNRNASAHYFCDATSIWQVVEDANAAWHCGGSAHSQGKGGSSRHGELGNHNTIGIELCCIKKNGKLIVDPAAIETAIPLVQSLMKQYNIPAKNVVRHRDITGKSCPGGYTTDAAWKELHSKLTTVAPTEAPTGPEIVDVTDFLVKVKAQSLNIRKGPGMEYDILGQINDKGTYTIVKTNAEGTWGLLKKGPIPGSSWISIRSAYVTKKAK